MTLFNIISKGFIKLLNPVLDVAFDYYRSIDKAKGDLGESNIGVRLRLGLSNK